MNVMATVGIRLDQLCRTCLCKTPRLFSVFDDSTQQKNTNHFAIGFLKDFCKIEVDAKRNLPSKVCGDCAEEIKRSYAFKIKCERSAEVLKRFTKERVEQDVDIATSAGRSGPAVDSNQPARSHQTSNTSNQSTVCNSSDSSLPACSIRLVDIARLKDTVQLAKERQSDSFQQAFITSPNIRVQSSNTSAVQSVNNLQQLLNSTPMSSDVASRANAQNHSSFPKVVSVGTLIPVQLNIQSNPAAIQVPINKQQPSSGSISISEPFRTTNEPPMTTSNSLRLHPLKPTDREDCPVSRKKLKKKVTEKRPEFSLLPATTVPESETTASSNEPTGHLNVTSNATSPNLICIDDDDDVIESVKEADSIVSQKADSEANGEVNRAGTPVTVIIQVDDETAQDKSDSDDISNRDGDNDVEMIEILEDDKENDENNANEGFVCHLCTKVISGEANFVAHITNHKSDVEHVRSSLPSDGTTLERRKESNSILTDLEKGDAIDSFLCHICNKLISGIDNFVEHVNTHSDGQREPQANSTPNTKDGAASYNCSTCKKPFTTSQQLSAHICQKDEETVPDVIDLDENDPLNVEILDKPGDNDEDATCNSFICHICKEVVDGNECFEDHVRSHAEPQEMKIMAMKTDSGFVCGECGTICKDKKLLISHVRTSHMLHSCSTCKKDFRSSEDLTKHIGLYSASKFGCAMCKKHFKSQLAFKAHQEKFHVDLSSGREFPCINCTRTFPNEFQYRIHLVGCRSKKMPYNCGMCSQSFETEIELNVHIAVHDTE